MSNPILQSEATLPVSATDSQGVSPLLGNIPQDPNTPGKEKHSGVYEQITNRIVALLEADTVPWQKPWNAQTSLPRNLVSKRPYRGINVFLLLLQGYQSPFWLTFNQANQLGGRIRKGEKACPIVFWKEINVEDKETGEKEQIRLLRFYYVFNVAQCEGLKNIPLLSEQFGSLVRPAEIVARMPQRPEVRLGMTQAFYSPAEDLVGMPSPERFTKHEEYYSTLFHELVHSTGHSKRLNRPTLTAKAGFGSDPYCKEELIAEMGAAFLCAHAGIQDLTLNNSASYISGWLGRLKSDKKLVVHAAAQAQMAADFILGTKPEESAPESFGPTISK